LLPHPLASIGHLSHHQRNALLLKLPDHFLVLLVVAIHLDEEAEFNEVEKLVEDDRLLIVFLGSEKFTTQTNERLVLAVGYAT
jgi:hypothetical protein